MRHISTDELLAHVRAWALAHFGRAPIGLKVSFETGPPFCAPFGQTNGTEPDEQPALSECEQDIVELVAAAGKRLTGEDVKKALQDAGKIHGDSTVSMALAALVGKKRVLDNRRDGRGRGYGLRAD